MVTSPIMSLSYRLRTENAWNKTETREIVDFISNFPLNSWNPILLPLNLDLVTTFFLTYFQRLKSRLSHVLGDSSSSPTRLFSRSRNTFVDLIFQSSRAYGKYIPFRKMIRTPPQCKQMLKQKHSR